MLARQIRDGNTCYDPALGSSLPCNEQPYFWPEGSAVAGSFVSQVIKVPPGQVVQFSALAHAFDWDLQSITYSLQNAPSGMQIDSSSAIVTWLVDSLMAGTYTVTVKATDPLGWEAQETVQLTVMTDADNAPPTFVSTPLITGRPSRWG